MYEAELSVARAQASPAVGAVLSFVADRDWVVRFTKSGANDQGVRSWSEHVIGWAVEVVYVDEETGSYETGIYPVVLDEGQYPVTVREYLQNRTGMGLTWKLVRRKSRA